MGLTLGHDRGWSGVQVGLSIQKKDPPRGDERKKIAELGVRCPKYAQAHTLEWEVDTGGLSKRNGGSVIAYLK